MKYFIKKQLILIFVIIIFCFLVIAYNKNIFYFQKSSLITPIIKDSPALASNTDSIQTEQEYPVRLKIPSIEVDAEIDYLGLTADGAMEVSKNADGLTWFSLGSSIGEEGSVVIAGHFDDINSQEGVFYNLRKLSKGDELFVEDSQGNLITFFVHEVRVYDSEVLAPEVFTSSEGQNLNLITCAGDWNRSRKEYTHRLVVFASTYTSQW